VAAKLPASPHYVSNDIGAIDPGRWQFWPDRSRIGMTSLLNVTGPPKSAP